MPAATLMTTLREIERRIQSNDASGAGALVVAAQEDAQELARWLLEVLADNTVLRERLERRERSLGRLAQRVRSDGLAQFSTTKDLDNLFGADVVS